MLAMAIFAPLIVDQNPRGAYQMPRDLTAVAVPPGSEGHPLGTTRLGGDVLYGIVRGRDCHCSCRSTSWPGRS